MRDEKFNYAGAMGESVAKFWCTNPLGSTGVMYIYSTPCGMRGLIRMWDQANTQFFSPLMVIAPSWTRSPTATWMVTSTGFAITQRYGAFISSYVLLACLEINNLNIKAFVCVDNSCYVYMILA